MSRGVSSLNEKDAEYFQRVAVIDLDVARVAAFGMTRRKGGRVEEDQGLASLVQAGTPCITMVGKSSAFQAAEVLLTTLEENLAMIAESVAFLRGREREVIFDAEHFFDGWKADRQYSLRADSYGGRGGSKMVVLCDTNGGAMPEEIATITREVVNNLPVPVGIHCHNDCGLAIANSLAAVDAGASQVQGTINGFGERCGNADLIAVIANLALKKRVRGPPPGRDRTPYRVVTLCLRTGEHEFSLRASRSSAVAPLHTRVECTSAAWPGRPPATSTSTRVRGERTADPGERAFGPVEHHGPAEKHKIEQDGKLMDRILAKVVSKEHAGTNSRRPTPSFDLLVKQCAGTFRPHFDLVYYHVNVEANEDGTWRTEATIKIRIGGQVRHEVADGRRPGQRAWTPPCERPCNGHFPCLARDAPGRLQGTGHQFRGGHGGRRPRGDRKPRRRGRLGHGGSERKHHRGQLDRTGRTASNTSCAKSCKPTKRNVTSLKPRRVAQAIRSRRRPGALVSLSGKAAATSIASRDPGSSPIFIVIPPPNVTGACTWATP